MLIPILAVSGLTILLFFLCTTPAGFVSPPTGFLLKLSAAMTKKNPLPREVAIRRQKSDEDFRIVSAMPSGKISIENRDIEGPRGSIPLRLYKPEGREPDTILIFIHGGGWVLGNVESYDPVARMLCVESQALVVSVDYRLAPEYRFPAAADDVLAAYEWILGERKASRISGKRVFVCGDSAGGTLATVLCLDARERKLPSPDGQILFYPVTDISRTDRESYGRFAEGYLLDRADMEWFIELYAPDGSARKDQRASPLLASSLSGLPGTLIFTAGLDVLRDEGETYAEALLKAGVQVESRRMRGLTHGFLSMSRFVPSARRCAKKAAAFMRKDTLAL